MDKSVPISILIALFEKEGFRHPVKEFAFHPDRRWRADIFFQPKLLIEYEGGVWGRGRHQRPKGFTDDCEKYSTASLLGYRVVRITEPMLKDGRAAELANLAAACLLRGE